jgi:hypothetical protein
MNDKQKYYEYDPLQSGKWWKKDRPQSEEWFEQELVDLAGRHTNGKPKLRVVWGGTVMSDIAETPQLKYKVTRLICTGWYYLTKDGEIGFTEKGLNTARDAAEPLQFEKKMERIELGRLRWAIEQYVPPEELRRLKRFTKLHSATGEKVLRDFPNEGVYDHFFWVQTAAHLYRDLDREVLTAVQAMYLYNINTSEAQKTLDDIERQRNQTLVGAAEARSIFNSM